MCQLLQVYSHDNIQSFAIRCLHVDIKETIPSQNLQNLYFLHVSYYIKISHHLQSCAHPKHSNHLTQPFSSTLENIIPQMFLVPLANLFP